MLEVLHIIRKRTMPYLQLSDVQLLRSRVTPCAGTHFPQRRPVTVCQENKMMTYCHGKVNIQDSSYRDRDPLILWMWNML